MSRVRMLSTEREKPWPSLPSTIWHSKSTADASPGRESAVSRLLTVIHQAEEPTQQEAWPRRRWQELRKGANGPAGAYSLISENCLVGKHPCHSKTNIHPREPAFSAATQPTKRLIHGNRRAETSSKEGTHPQAHKRQLSYSLSLLPSLSLPRSKHPGVRVREGIPKEGHALHLQRERERAEQTVHAPLYCTSPVGLCSLLREQLSGAHEFPPTAFFPPLLY